MATFYFNGAVDGEWTELDNWWTNENFTVAATALPTSADSVVASAAISTNSGSAPTVVNLTMAGASLSIDITVTGDAIFDNGASNYLGNVTVTGTAYFDNGSYNSQMAFQVDGTVIGNAVFSNISYNQGTVTGNAVFNSASYNGNIGLGDVTGNATFNDDSYNEGSVGGAATFNQYARNGDGDGSVPTASTVGGSVDGAATFNDYSQNAPSAVINLGGEFNDESVNYGKTLGAAAVFNDNSFTFCYDLNIDYIGGGAVFKDSSYNKSSIESAVTVVRERGVNGSSILGVV